MASSSGSAFKRSSYNSRIAFIDKSSGRTTGAADDVLLVDRIEVGEDPAPPLQQDLEGLSVSKRVVRNLSHKLRRNKGILRGDDAMEGEGGERVPFRCLGFYGKGGGCKVGACDDIDIGGRRKSTATDLGTPQRSVLSVERSGLECFSHGVADLIRIRNVRKVKESGQSVLVLASAPQFPLPDDLLEMCLVRLPLPALQAARLVCRKWRYLTTTPHFVKLRSEGFHQTSWLFLFGIIRDGFSAGEIHALDISLNQWHRVCADALKGRFLFSVATVGSDLYVVGGCSGSTNSGTLTGRNPFRTHRGVMLFSPLTGTWRKASPMKFTRSGPILGVFEVGSSFDTFHSRRDRREPRQSKARAGKTSDVYDDPHRFSLRRQLRDILNDTDDLPDFGRKSSTFVREGKVKESRFILVAVGGRGSWDEPLDSGEIYDPMVDRWMEIEKLPGDLGAVCTGTVCNDMFYVYSETDKLAGYDLEKGIWVMFQTSHTPPRLHEYHPGLVSSNGRLFMLCVSWCERDRQLGRREKAVRKLWELDLSLLAWTEVSRHPDAPMDWNAAFVADRNKIYGIEMFKIFGQVLHFLTVCDVSGLELKWGHISRKHATQAADASSCTTKLMAVMHL